MKKNSGITLIALVITIIILIILAGITISAVFGENGLILRAQEAKFKTEVSGIRDLVEVKRLEIEAANELKQSTQSLSAYLNSLGMPQYIGVSRLVIDGKKKLAYNDSGDFSRQQKDWLNDIGIYAAEEGNAELVAAIENKGETDYLVLHLRFNEENDNDAFRYVCVNINALKDFGTDFIGLGAGYLEDFVLSLVNEFYHEEYADMEEVLQAISIRDFLSSQLDTQLEDLVDMAFQIEVSFNPSIITSSPSISIATLENFVGFLPPADTYTFYYTGMAGDLETTITVPVDLEYIQPNIPFTATKIMGFDQEGYESYIYVGLGMSSTNTIAQNITILEDAFHVPHGTLNGMQVGIESLYSEEARQAFWSFFIIKLVVEMANGEICITGPRGHELVINSITYNDSGCTIIGENMVVVKEPTIVPCIYLGESGEWKFQLFIPGVGIYDIPFYIPSI